MASSNALQSHLEGLRFGNPQSPPSEGAYSGYSTPTRYSGSFMPTHSQPSTNDARASLQRRFTADSGRVPTLTPIGQPTTQALENVDMSATTHFKVQALERKRQEYQKLSEQRKKFEAELEKFNLQQAREKQEIDDLAQDLGGTVLSSGHQSEPTTPPEYHDTIFPGGLSYRRNRYSSSSLMSPPGLINRSSRSGSQLASPPAELIQSHSNVSNSDKLPSKSVPGSRRGSTDRVSSYLPETTVIGQRATKANRYSMPVASSIARKRESVPEYSSIMGVGHINTTSFLFGEDDEVSGQKESTTSPDVNTYLQMNTTDDKFPILVRNNHHPGLLSASSAALDLALTQAPAADSNGNPWTQLPRHRQGQQSLPQNVYDNSGSSQNVESPTSISQFSLETPIESPASARNLNRRSLEATLASYAQKNFSPLTTSGAGSGRPTRANLQSSYSTNDIPTLKNQNGLTAPISPPKSTTAQQQFHNHNASLGRIPQNVVNPRHSREMSSGEVRREEQTNGYKHVQSELQASAAPFGPSVSATSQPEQPSANVASMNMAQYPPTPYYGGYGMQQLMSMGMSPVQIPGNPLAFNSQIYPYQTQNPYSQYGQQARFSDSQARVIQQRRMQNMEDVARFTNIKIEQCQGQIYALCKDQHGCRYLQKQLESRNRDIVHIIFLETSAHVVELMTDPFGNYLCQKLLEFSNDEERTVLINNAAPQMVKIALNQHGTRALQKMIEFITTGEQIQTIIHALKDRVVELIQDLNGNHVIQKCLNRLSPLDAQFIFDAVGTHCVVVGTHRHGCCVLQRCIDHASGEQKGQLISQITQNAFELVQDPFGNYVLQYIVDLGEPIYTEPLCYVFGNSIPKLSKQKFSSNVIEKCLRGAQPHIATMMVEEMLNANELEGMLRDSYANYVVQTALEYTEPGTRARLVEAIRPILPAIRQTPYGRRIQSKILGGEGQDRLSGLSTPNDTSSPGQIPISRHITNGASPNLFNTQQLDELHNAQQSYAGPTQNGFAPNGMINGAQFGSPQLISGMPAHRYSGSSTYGQAFTPPRNPPAVQQPVPIYGRNLQSNGFNYF